MNPCFVTTSFSPQQLNSGISNALSLLTKYLHDEKGIRSTVFAPVQPWGKADQETKHVSVRRFTKSNALNYGYSLDLKEMLEKEYNKQTFDLIHSYHYGFFPATAGYNFANRHGMPHFLTAAFHPPSSAFKRFLMGSYNFTQGRTILSGSIVFPFNKNERDQLAHYYGKMKHKIIPCPVNDDIFYPRKTKFIRPTVTFIGTFLPWKGPQIALEIFKRISKTRKDIDFILVGSGPMEEYLKQNAGKNIRVLPNLSSNKVAEMLSKSHVVVCPTAYESFGSAIAESMMCGTPVITTRVGAVPETVGSGGRLVEYGDWNNMRKNIENLIDDDKSRKKLANAAIKQSEKYKYRKVAATIYAAYRTAL